MRFADRHRRGDHGHGRGRDYDRHDRWDRRRRHRRRRRYWDPRYRRYYWGWY
ncbi:hypothetical protein [Gordonia araii]|uniref:hypothetical protein n=1 Tax=Gordonia araii TaxID=263909 RepID=UPI00147863FE|nr:hypothetical protein [Gordonia araii]NNG97276.1 hypothetical protein [Gordonia araii NBRC 100433]